MLFPRDLWRATPMSPRITRAWRMARARASLGTPWRARLTPWRVPTKVLLGIPLVLRVLACSRATPMSPRITRSWRMARARASLGTPWRARPTPWRVPTPKVLLGIPLVLRVLACSRETPMSPRITRAWRMARARASLGTPWRARPTPRRVTAKVLLGKTFLVLLKLFPRVQASSRASSDCHRE